MSAEFEKLVLEKLDFTTEKLKKLDLDVTELKEDVAILKTDVAGLKKDVTKLKTNINTLERGMKEVKQHISVLENEVFNVIKPKINSIEQKVDLMINVNTAKILENQIRNHKEIMKKFDKYQRENELDHSRLNYEICRLKANA